MRAIALVLAAAGGLATAQEAPPVVHTSRLDQVGLAGRGGDAAASNAFVVHASLPPGSFVEVTALDSGRTIVAEVREESMLPPDRIADLSSAAAAALRLSDTPLAAVRIRPAAPSPQEQHGLRGGGIVTRLDAPSALLVALRRKLPAGRRPSPDMAVHSVNPPPGAKPFRPAPSPAPRLPTTPATAAVPGGWMVQVAALSDAGRAAALAKSVGGVVRGTGTLYRIQTGPFTTRAAADRARADIARRGFGDARIIAPD